MDRYQENIRFIEKYVDEWDKKTNYGEDTSMLTQEEKNAYFVELLNSEVNSGGFESYLTSDSYYPGKKELCTALDAIGAQNVKKIIKKVSKKFPFWHIPKSLKLREKLLIDFEWPNLDNLDDEFFEYPDPLDELVKKYIEDNIRYGE